MRRVSLSTAVIANDYHAYYVPGTVLNILQILANLVLTETPILKVRKQRPTVVKVFCLRSHITGVS